MTIYKQILDKIKEKNKLAEGDSIDYEKTGYEPLPITKANFVKLEETKNKKIAFIDGGNACLIETPAYCVHFVRVFGALFQDDKKILNKKYECFVLGAKNEIDLFWEGEKLDEIEAFGEIERVGDLVRKQCEIILSKKFAEKADLVVLDGTLEATTKNEEKLFSELYSAAEKNNCIVAALAKTTSLTTKRGASAAAYIASIGPQGTWECNNIIKTNSKMHQANISFVKLNKNSKHIFRFETHNSKEVASWLLPHCNDASFPGYPYGLIYADKFARVSNEEKNYFVTHFLAAHG
ncbi:MAG: DNA double-strand break repair nuclease NurA, partial [Candidatus Woesearchaeota archaeon]